MKKFSLLIAAFLFVFSSFSQRDGIDRSGNVNIDDQFTDLMEIQSGGIFRGINFDMSKQAVSDYETNRLTTSVYQDEEDLLTITTDMGPDILNFADVTYKFDDKGLYHIKVETYGTDPKVVDEVFEKIKDYYTNTLGKSYLASDGYLEFYGKSKSYDYTVAIENLGYEDSPGIYMYFSIGSSSGLRDGFDRNGVVTVDDQYADLMEVESGGIFRGVNFNMSKEAVKNYELDRNTTSVYQEDEPNELIITTDMGDDILNFADITYKFDEQGLYHIKVETYGTDAKSVEKVYDMVKEFYTNKLGSGVIAEDGYLEFYGKNRSYNYTVAMENLGYEDSPGMYIYVYISE